MCGWFRLHKGALPKRPVTTGKVLLTLPQSGQNNGPRSANGRQTSLLQYSLLKDPGYSRGSRMRIETSVADGHMMAVVTTGTGGYDKLDYTQVAVPTPSRGQVLLQVLAFDRDLKRA